MNKRKVGYDKEELAATHLEQQGLVILQRNFSCRQGEIDIVACHGAYLVFVEVKYRSGDSMGTALGAVDYRKQRRICRVADYYRVLHKIGSQRMIRYDVVAIQGDKIQWIQNAFPHIYTRG